jgi:hypothetical protein
MQRVTRLVRRGARRLISRSDIIVLRAGPEDVPSRVESQYVSVRVTFGTRAERIDEAMRSVGEDPMLTPPRLAHGDECFGWE